MMLKVITSLFTTLLITIKTLANPSMQSQSKYQFGGSDLNSSSFFSNVASYIGTTQNNQESEQPALEQDTVDSEDDTDYSEDDYSDLQSRYDDLYSENETLKRSLTNNTFNDDEFLNFLFSGSESTLPIQFSQEELYPDSIPRNPSLKTDSVKSSNYKGEILSSGKFKNENVGEQGRQIYKDVAELLGYSPVANSIFRSKEYNNSLIKKGIPASPTSYHLSGNAIDFKPDDWKKLKEEQQQYLKNKYDVIYHNNHYHVEPKKTGGYATTPEELYKGLNGSSLKKMTLNLPKKYNLIRGLDSEEPIEVTDELNNKAILLNSQDTTKMYGKVKEIKL